MGDDTHLQVCLTVGVASLEAHPGVLLARPSLTNVQTTVHIPSPLNR